MGELRDASLKGMNGSRAYIVQGSKNLSPSNLLHSVAGPMNPTDQSQVNKRKNSLNYLRTCRSS